ncbi:MAG: hypothetical protein HZA30_01005 [Candidatus Omnitrophica bacterium]|nr:hypothetical protein [Candidatus Omnitrophota bacterium]
MNERLEFEGTVTNFGRNLTIVTAIVILFGLALHFFTNLNFYQVISCTIFLAAVLETMVFWAFRMGIALICIATLLLTKTIDIPHLIEFTNLDVILFLIGMMTITGMVSEIGFFRWLMIKMVKLSRFKLYPFVILLCFTSMFLAMLVDEVTSIIFTTAIVIEICSLFGMNPIPLVITTVLATNVGSSGTVLGNPIGILIAMKGDLSFEDFLHWAFPVTLLALISIIFVILLRYRRYFREFQDKVNSKNKQDSLHLFSEWEAVKNLKDFKIGMGIFFVTLVFIALHHRIENAFGLLHNTMLLIPVFIGSGIVFLWKRLKARQYMEREVDWRTLIFFMLLFAKAGTLKYVGVTDIIANKLVHIAGASLPILTTIILWIATLGSSVLDNVVLVAALIPVIQNFASMGIHIGPLWWALLFGGCFGGNITMIGSTANIIALGILEKKCSVEDKCIKISFFQWLWIGLVAGVVTTLVAQVFLLIFYRFM